MWCLHHVVLPAKIDPWEFKTTRIECDEIEKSLDFEQKLKRRSRV